MEVEELKVKNQKLLEDLTMTQNQERAAKEKSEHLEIDFKKLQQRLDGQEGVAEEGTLRDQILSKEMIEDRQGMLGDL